LEARPQGGDRRSGALEVQRDWLLQLVAEAADLTLAEIRDRLGERGTLASISVIWRFLDRYGISFKKEPPTPPNRPAPTSTPRVSSGAPTKTGLTPPGSPLSTRPGPPPTWPECGVAVRAAPARSLEDHYLCRWTAP
jgi:hypothetical protein